MDTKLNGKTALVTGSTGGIGLAIADALAGEGAVVWVSGRDEGRVAEAVAKVGRGARGLVADVTTPEGAARAIAALPDVDILVNNLGIYESKAFADIDDAGWQRMFDVNVMSGVRLARHHLPRMLARKAGRIVFVSSETGLLVDPQMIHYGMTKAAQLAIARGMSQLTRGTEVTVNTVLPGPTRSAGIGDFLKSVATDPNATVAEAEREFFATKRAGSLLGRMIEPEEVASLVVYLASPLSAATNGAALRVEGGLVPTSA